jgi:quercetin dioxygenase-like cupin family protein
MKLIKFDEAESYEPEKNWKRSSLCNEKDISVEHFIKPPNHASPSHQHPNAQVLIVFKGTMSVINEKGESYTLNKGDAIYIPENESHVVKNDLDQPSIGIDIFIPGRSFDFWLKRKQKH